MSKTPRPPRRGGPGESETVVSVVVLPLRQIGDHVAGEVVELPLADAEGLVERGMVDPADAPARKALKRALERRDDGSV